jgi:hypothetical protein
MLISDCGSAKYNMQVYSNACSAHSDVKVAPSQVLHPSDPSCGSCVDGRGSFAYFIICDIHHILVVASLEDRSGLMDSDLEVENYIPLLDAPKFKHGRCAMIQ